MTSSTAIRRATTADLEDLVPLFDAYRVFYGQPADSQRARRFLADRLQSGDSVLLLAESKGAAAGFTQIYPTYSSVSTARVWVLNDLFIAPPARRKGVARALLCAAEAFARTDGALRLELETMPDNDTAQALYRGCGWQPYNATLRFRLPLGRS